MGAHDLGKIVLDRVGTDWPSDKPDDNQKGEDHRLSTCDESAGCRHAYVATLREKGENSVSAGPRPDPPDQAAAKSDNVATEHHHDPDCRGNHRGNGHHGLRAKISEEHSQNLVSNPADRSRFTALLQEGTICPPTGKSL
jgi:hypothetical protein